MRGPVALKCYPPILQEAYNCINFTLLGSCATTRTRDGGPSDDKRTALALRPNNVMWSSRDDQV